MFVLAAPTGSGKSVILYTVARAINDVDSLDSFGTIFTTSQILLQEQYEKDFSDIFVLKGRANYPCSSPATDDDQSCANGTCLYQKGSTTCRDNCPYRIAKEKAIYSPLVTENSAYFIGESNNVNALGVRRLLVIDEAHNIENALMSYVEAVISKSILKFCGIEKEVPIYDDFNKYGPFLDNLQIEIKEKIEDIEETMNENPLTVFTGEAKKLDRLKKLFDKISFIKFHSNTCRWIADADEEKHRVSFKPININPFARNMVFNYADKIIMSSATISKSYVRDCLGVSEDEFEYLEMPSFFPVDNRPVYGLNSGRMSYQYLDNTMPNIVRDVDYVLRKFEGKKGIVHATSYKIAKYVYENSVFRDRFITHNSIDRIEKLKEHMASKTDTVLLSPSMTEGVDLKGDLSEFQIIVKIPYPSLADKQIKARAEEDPLWYKNLAAVTLMQAYGRSIRSKDDIAMTFVLDSGFKYFVKSNQQLFCKWFMEAIR
jgi:Rad3-related DNA helicase